MPEDKATTSKKPSKDSAEPTEELSSDKIHIKLYSPFQTYFNGEAKSISAENDTGPFDVLPRHHSFISLLNACELRIDSDQGEKRIRISQGVMHVRNNQVTVFLDV